ncbi:MULTISPECIES: tyrosine-type recombinase/integrase [Leptotrichia]|uniref:tyrosine-type recombinase/integrase n=1 Tax=Leptotrichia TaxID=32067 RepID=UPI0003ADF8E5|nr:MULTISPECIES: tyrosine-type recombinase/integrase [Leptotrichia]ERL26997.1 site-specific recombinase, phage integrase family [Leptotrichia sp. oral taxon 225 str. F0581]WLD75240.1 tyrosine-type recombinase/integrase [Leptotrichia sp. HMT-225]
MGRKKRRTRKLNGAGSITKLSGKRNKPWMVRTPGEIQIDGTIKRTVLGYYTTSEEAEIALAKYKIMPFNIDEKNTTLNDLWKIWYEKKQAEVTKRSHERYYKSYNLYLSHLKNKPIRELTYHELQQAISVPVKGTSKYLKTLLNKIYKMAMKNNIVDKDISELLEISQKKSVTRPVKVIDIKTIKKIRKYSNENNCTNKLKKIADMTLIMLYTGMRSGEIRSIKKENIFFNENYMIGGIKTEAGKDRIIPIHPKIKDLIIFYYNEFPNKDFLFSQTKSKKAFSEVTFVNNFIEFRNLLNFTNNRHACRHTFITELKKLNVTESKIKRIVGHKSLDVTDGVYTHYSPQDLLIEVKKLDYGD